MVFKFKILGIAIALAVAVAASTYFVGKSEVEPSSSAILTAAAIVPTGVTTVQVSSNGVEHIQKVSVSPYYSANSLESSRELRDIYDRYKDSNDVAERYTAYRAWMACFPTFVALNGQATSLQALTQSLPNDGGKGVDRESAYRALQARCLGFSKMSRDEILEANRMQQEANNRGTLASPGEQAEKFLSDGNKEAALTILRKAIAAGDLFAISSMREFVNQFIVLQVDAQTVHSVERPDLRSLAFTLAACQMGLECGQDSLSALQLCTSLGQCSGGVSDRYQQALPNQADRDAVAIETRRVINAIKSGDFNALGLK